MTARDKPTIKGYFQNGKSPNQDHYADLIDSYQDAGSVGSVATGAEIDTGTDNVKYVSPKAIRDSGLISGAVPAEISGLTDKATPVDADVILAENSANSFSKIKITWSNIKFTLNTYFGGIFAPIAKGVTNGDSHDHNGGDGSRIPYSGIQDVSGADRILGRINYGVGPVEELTQANVRTIIGAGSGYGLDADMLDGIHGTQFVRNDVGGQTTGPSFTIKKASTDHQGGVLILEKTTGGSLTGSPLIDLYDNSLRIYESGANYRGAFLDLSKCLDGATSRLWHDTIVQGTSFPSDPYTGRQFFRTDLGLDCFYDGSRWLTKNLFTASMSQLSLSGTSSGGGTALWNTYQFYIERIVVQIKVSGTHNASNYWDVYARSINNGYGAATTLYTFNTNGLAAGVFYDKSVTPGTRTDATNKYWLDWSANKINAPGNIDFLFFTYVFRYIIT